MNAVDVFHGFMLGRHVAFATIKTYPFETGEFVLSLKCLCSSKNSGTSTRSTWFTENSNRFEKFSDALGPVEECVLGHRVSILRLVTPKLEAFWLCPFGSNF